MELDSETIDWRKSLITNWRLLELIPWEMFANIIMLQILVFIKKWQNILIDVDDLYLKISKY